MAHWQCLPIRDLETKRHNFFSPRTFFEPNIFLHQHFFFRLKIFWGPNFFDPQFFCLQNFVGPIIFSDQNFFLTQHFFLFLKFAQTQNLFRPNIFSDPKLISMKDDLQSEKTELLNLRLWKLAKANVLLYLELAYS